MIDSMNFDLAFLLLFYFLAYKIDESGLATKWLTVQDDAKMIGNDCFLNQL